MQNGSSPQHIKVTGKTSPAVTIRIRLEPELEVIAATWSPAQCDEHAAKLERFARQLRVKARILRRDQVPLRKKLRWQQPSLTLRN